MHCFVTYVKFACSIVERYDQYVLFLAPLSKALNDKKLLSPCTVVYKYMCMPLAKTC